MRRCWSHTPVKLWEGGVEAQTRWFSLLGRHSNQEALVEHNGLYVMMLFSESGFERQYR